MPSDKNCLFVPIESKENKFYIRKNFSSLTSPYLKQLTFFIFPNFLLYFTVYLAVE